MTVQTSPTTALKKREFYLRAKMRSHKKSIMKSHRSLKKETLFKFAVASSGVTKVEPVKVAISFDLGVLCMVENNKVVIQGGNNIISCDAQSCRVCIDEDCLKYKASLIRGGNDTNNDNQMRDDNEAMSDDYEISSVSSFEFVQPSTNMNEQSLTQDIETPAIVIEPLLPQNEETLLAQRAQLAATSMQQLRTNPIGARFNMDANLPAPVELDNIGAMNVVCFYCNALGYKCEEKKTNGDVHLGQMCCNKGKSMFLTFLTYPVTCGTFIWEQMQRQNIFASM
jgi:hypothetical protein